MSKQKKVINIKQRNLLIKSSIIEEYPDLKELLNNYKSVSQQMVDECEGMDKTTQDLLLTKSAFDEIYKAALKEWQAEVNNDIDDKKCMLCNADNKRIFYIRNIVNGNSMNVGSECVKAFQNSDEVIEVNKSIKVQNDRRVKVRKRFINLKDRLEIYEKALNNSPYLLNFKLYNNGIRLIDEIKMIEEEYIKGEKNITCFEKIDEKLNNLEKIVSISIPYTNDKLKNIKYACKKEVADWILKSNKEENLKKSMILNIRKNNSCIGADTITEISYLPFIEEHLKEYEELTKDVFYDIRPVSEGGFTVFYINLKNKSFKNVSFCFTPENFMRKLGDIVFLQKENTDLFKKKLSLPFLFTNVLSLYNEDNNIYNLYSMLNIKFRNYFEFIFDYESEITYIINKELGTYTEFSGTGKIVKNLLQYFDENMYYDLQNNCKEALLKNFIWKKITTNVLDTLKNVKKDVNNTQFAYY